MIDTKNNNITFVVFTFNESQRIERVIKNFKNFGKILIVDNYSSDETVLIAQREGCDILMNKNPGWCEDVVTTSRVKDAVTTDWIYWANADEMIENDTIVEIISTIRSEKYDIISIKRKNYYYGKFLHEAYADRSNRIFKKDAIDFTGNKIHHFGRVLVPSDRIKIEPENIFVHHFISNTAKSYVNSLDRYTDIEAENDIKSDAFLVILKGLRSSLWNYFVRGAYKAGPPGLYICILMVFYPLLAMMKRYEKRMRIDRVEIERLHDIKRDAILDNLIKPE
jgi:glycosyltransferase involved in cell wall biosynthesis